MFRMDLSQIPLFAMLRGRLGYLSERQQVIAQNVANSDTPRFQPKDLKPFSFQAQVQNQATSAASVTHPGHIPLGRAQGGLTSGWNPIVQRDFKSTYEPGNPGADAQGYVKEPNVDPLIEALDMKEAQRAYEANLNVIETARAMDMRTLELLRK
jgi:flagellar basal-body rod protein FlgC